MMTHRPSPSRSSTHARSAAISRGPALAARPWAFGSLAWLGLFLSSLMLISGCGEDNEGSSKDAKTSESGDVTGSGDLDAAGSAEDAKGGAQDGGPTFEDTAPEDTANEGPPTSTAKNISELTFQIPKIWSNPLSQYLEDGNKKLKHWNFRRAVHDLAVYQDRLYMGYGDADNNLGHVTPIACRYWDDPTKKVPKDEFLLDEEELQRYRLIDDELWIAGLDATEDGWLGNVYFRTPTKPWVKHRTVQNGVHVHDIARWKGALYAVGSGAEPSQWKQGNVWGHLWKSQDTGEKWEIVAKQWNAQDGDARWVALLPVKDRLYVFGYWITKQGSLTLPNGVWTGEGDTPEVKSLSGGNPLKTAFVLNTWPIDADRGLVAGRDFLKSPASNAAWLVQGDKVSLVQAFAGMTLVDVFVYPSSGEVLALTRDGDMPDKSHEGEVWQLKVWRSKDMKTWEKLLDFPAGDRAVSLAYWRGALYFGSFGGQVWRSSASWK